MDVHGEPEQHVIYADWSCLNCDTPAARKFSGTAGHAHNVHPCLYCDTILLNINKPEGYDKSTVSNPYPFRF
jgi:hypothetical protein